MIVLALGETFAATGMLGKTPHANMSAISRLFCFPYFSEYVKGDAFLVANGRA